MSPGTAASPELVIFDCDGALVDSEPIVARVLTEWMRDLGVRITYEASLGAGWQEALSPPRRAGARPAT